MSLEGSFQDKCGALGVETLPVQLTGNVTKMRADGTERNGQNDVRILHLGKICLYRPSFFL